MRKFFCRFSFSFFSFQINFILLPEIKASFKQSMRFGFYWQKCINNLKKSGNSISFSWFEYVLICQFKIDNQISFNMIAQPSNYTVNNLWFSPKMSLQIEFTFGHLRCQWVNHKRIIFFKIILWHIFVLKKLCESAHLSIMMLNGFFL